MDFGGLLDSDVLEPVVVCDELSDFDVLMVVVVFVVGLIVTIAGLVSQARLVSPSRTSV